MNMNIAIVRLCSYVKGQAVCILRLKEEQEVSRKSAWRVEEL